MVFCSRACCFANEKRTPIYDNLVHALDRPLRVLALRSVLSRAGASLSVRTC